jgi:hypothetical protein
MIANLNLKLPEIRHIKSNKKEVALIHAVGIDNAKLPNTNKK